MSTVLDVILRAQVQGLDDFTKNLRSAAEESFDLDYSRLEKGFKKAGDQFTKMMKQAVDLDIKFDVSSLRTLKREYTSQMGAAAVEVANLERKLKEGNLDALGKRAAKAAVQTQKLAMKEAQKRFDKEIKTQSRVLDMATQHVEMVKKGYSEAASELSDGFSDAVGDLSSALQSGDLGGMLKGLGKSAKGMGGKMEGKAAAAGPQAGGMTKMLGGIGKLMGKLGPALMAVGAIAGAFMMVAKLIMDADDKVKEFNKELVDSVGGATLLASQFGDVGKSMKSVRDFARGLKSQWSLKAMDKELVGIIGGFDEAGHTMNEMTNDLEDMTSAAADFSHNMEIALTYSRLLGIDSKQMATDMGTYMEELGLTIDGVAARFSSVTRAAMDSGFGVKRFYSMVLQATSGMSMYNVRLEEASGLLIRIGKILGSKVGGEFMSKLGKGFVDESMVDRYKRVMLTGTKRMKGIFMRSAEDTALDFTGKLADKLKGNKELQSALTDAMSDVKGAGGAIKTLGGGGALGKEDRAALIKSLGSMTDKQQAVMLAKIRGQDADLARELDKLVDVSRGATGKQGDLVKHLDSLDMGGKLNALMNSAKGLFGKELYQLSAKQLAAVESATGLSGEALKEMMQISKGLDGQWSMLKSLKGKQVQDPLDATKKIAQEYAGKSAEEIKKAQAAQVKSSGAYMTKTGDIVAAKIDKEGAIIAESMTPLKNLGDYVQSSGDTYAGSMGDQVAEDIELAREIADNTWKTSNALEMGVTWFLERIYDVCQGILKWVMPGMSEDERENRGEAVKNLDAVAKDLREKKNDMRMEIREEQKKLKKETDPAKRDVIKLNLEKMTEQMEKMDFLSKTYQKAGRDASNDDKSGNYGIFGWFGSDRSTEDFEKTAMTKAATDDETKLRAQKTMPTTMTRVAHEAEIAFTASERDSSTKALEDAITGLLADKDRGRTGKLTEKELAKAVVTANNTIKANVGEGRYDDAKIKFKGSTKKYGGKGQGHSYNPAQLNIGQTDISPQILSNEEVTETETRFRLKPGAQMAAKNRNPSGKGGFTMKSRAENPELYESYQHSETSKQSTFDPEKLGKSIEVIREAEIQAAQEKALQATIGSMVGDTSAIAEGIRKEGEARKVEIARLKTVQTATEKLEKGEYAVAYAKEYVKAIKKEKALDVARAAGLTGRSAEVAADALVAGKAPANVVAGLKGTRTRKKADGSGSETVRKTAGMEGILGSEFGKLWSKIEAGRAKDFLYVAGEGVTHIPETTQMIGVDQRDTIKRGLDADGKATLMGSYSGSPANRALAGGGVNRGVSGPASGAPGAPGASGASGAVSIHVRNDTDARRLVKLIQTTVGAMNGGGTGRRRGKA